MRQRAVNLILIAVFTFLFLGVFNLEVIHGRKYRELSNKNCIRLLPQMGSRGRILDRDGEVIVGNRLSYNVMVMPQKGAAMENTFLQLAKILGKGARELKDKFQEGYVTPFIPVSVADNIEIRKAIALEEMRPELSEMSIQPYPLRNYPYSRIGCHFIGYLNEIDHWRLTKLADYGYETKDIVGFGGVEEKYDYYLRQQEGGLSLEVDHRGRTVRVLGFRPPANGRDMQLTINLKIQRIVEEKLGEKKGSVVLMDPHTGEIIAMSSRPNFNPELFVKKKGSAISGIFADSDAPLINRAISSSYPPASVFKLVLASAALESGKAVPATTFSCSGSTYVGKRRYGCWDTHGQQNLTQAIAHSCDVFFYKTGLAVGSALMHDYAEKFGFSKPTGIDLPYETGGFVPHPAWQRLNRLKAWLDGDTANFAIGQGDLLTTPLQIARMVAVFANKGSLVTPYIVKAVDGRDLGVLKRHADSVSLKQNTINCVREGMREVVSDPSGTANILSGLPVTVAGKTGTAQVANKQPHGWFSGFFPFKEPKFVICVFLEHGGSGYYAAVLTRQIIEEMGKEGLI